MSILDSYKDNSLKYDEFIKSNKCWIYLNNIFVIGYIDECDDFHIVSGKYKSSEFMFKIIDHNSYKDFKINKFNEK